MRVSTVRVHIGRWLVAVAGLVAFLLVGAGPAAAVPPMPGQPGAAAASPSFYGGYLPEADYTGSVAITDLRGWRLTWQIPSHTGPGDFAIGQWFDHLETGIYYTDSWWVYYYGDSDGVTGNNSDCNPIFTDSNGVPVGAACDVGDKALTGMQPGAQVTFTYQTCGPDKVASLTGAYLCTWVDMHDGKGDRFLAYELHETGTREMFTHDVESFGGTTGPNSTISCTQPVRMLGQQIRTSAGQWVTLTGNQWTFNDTAPLYQYQNVNLSASPATWEACSRPVTVPACPAAWNATTLYSTGQEVGYAGYRWRARWWTYGDVPTNAPNTAWERIDACA
jgi:hypothetical protein